MSAKKCSMKTLSTKNDPAILDRLYDVVQDRRSNPRQDSYVSALLQEDAEKIHAKLMEEAWEVVEASRDTDRKAVIHEIADLWFHCLVLMGARDIPPEDIYSELMKRWGKPGLQEKKERRKNALLPET